MLPVGDPIGDGSRAAPLPAEPERGTREGCPCLWTQDWSFAFLRIGTMSYQRYCHGGISVQAPYRTSTAASGKHDSDEYSWQSPRAIPSRAQVYRGHPPR